MKPKGIADGQGHGDGQCGEIQNRARLEHIVAEQKDSVQDYFAREVVPYVPDDQIDDSYRDDKDKEIGKVGYEINFNRYFYKYVPSRKMHDIDE